jgi:hypothetical protein
VVQSVSEIGGEKILLEVQSKRECCITRLFRRMWQLESKYSNVRFLDQCLPQLEANACSS